MLWNKSRILQKLKQLHRAGDDLSYNAMCRTHQPLVSAAAYHFGSYRDAVRKAGIDYASVVRRPRWTKDAIVQLIKQAKRRGEDLHWAAVTRRRDELGKAAFASLQSRLFGSWDRALTSAGLDAAKISRYRSWDRGSIVAKLRAMSRGHQPLNSGAVQVQDPGFHAAAIRHFGSYDSALRGARVDPSRVRKRRAWTREEVLRQLKTAARSGQSLSGSVMRREAPALYGAAIRLFGTFTKARKSAGLTYKRRPRTA